MGVGSLLFQKRRLRTIRNARIINHHIPMKRVLHYTYSKIEPIRSEPSFQLFMELGQGKSMSLNYVYRQTEIELKAFVRREILRGVDPVSHRLMGTALI